MAPTTAIADDPTDDAPDKSRDFVQSLERGLAVIKVFNAERPSLTVSEIAAIAGLTRATARRFLLTLIELGYVATKNNRFELTSRVLELGYAYLSSLSFPEIALPHLQRLVQQSQEGSEGSVLDGTDIIYVVQVPGPALMTISVNIGARMPAHATSMGRVLLAYLPPAQLDDYLAKVQLTQILPRTITDPVKFRAELVKVRDQGFAMVNQELEEGLIAVAVPIRDRMGVVRAAINLSTHVGRKSIDDMRDLIPQLKDAAANIENGLAHATGWSS